MRVTRVAVIGTVALLAAQTAAAQGIECGKPIQQAQAAIDKTTDDLKGME